MFQSRAVNNPRRKVAYPMPGGNLYIPTLIWTATLESLRRYAPELAEGLLFWGGVIGATGEVYVITLYRVNHPPQGSRVKPSRQSMRQLVRYLHAKDQKLVAQVHSHPREAFHSYGDDDNAASYHPGYISIVVPSFGIKTTDISQCAVYEYSGQAFEPLSENELASRIHMEDQIVELSPWAPSQAESVWKKLSEKLRFIAPKKP